MPEKINNKKHLVVTLRCPSYLNINMLYFFVLNTVRQRLKDRGGKNNKEPPPPQKPNTYSLMNVGWVGSLGQVIHCSPSGLSKLPRFIFSAFTEQPFVIKLSLTSEGSRGRQCQHSFVRTNVMNQIKGKISFNSKASSLLGRLDSIIIQKKMGMVNLTICSLSIALSHTLAHNHTHTHIMLSTFA